MNSPTNSSPRIAIVIPAYNEANTIAEVVRQIGEKFMDTAYLIEVVVVDDGSKDDTAARAAAASATVIKHILNSGTGSATATGLSYAQQNGFNAAATMDADGQHHVSDVKKGIDLIINGDDDLLIGSRLIDSAGMSRVKQIGNRGLSLITFALFRIYVTDSQSGLRIFSERALIELRWKTSGYEFCSEMLWRAKQLGLSIGEYPIQAIYTDYSKLKGQNNWNGVNIIKSLLQRRIMEIFGE